MGKIPNRDDLTALIDRACEIYEKLPPIERAIADLEQRRSFVLGNGGWDWTVERRKAAEAYIDSRPEFVLLAAYLELKKIKSEG